jgi:hypothetical protein
MTGDEQKVVLDWNVITQVPRWLCDLGAVELPSGRALTEEERREYLRQLQEHPCTDVTEDSWGP